MVLGKHSVASREEDRLGAATAACREAFAGIAFERPSAAVEFVAAAFDSSVVRQASGSHPYPLTFACSGSHQGSSWVVGLRQALLEVQWVAQITARHLFNLLLLVLVAAAYLIKFNY